MHLSTFSLKIVGFCVAVNIACAVLYNVDIVDVVHIH